MTVYRAFATFLLGHLLLELPRWPAKNQSARMTPATVGPVSCPDSQLLTSLSAQLSRDAFEEEFDNALHDLIKRVASFHS